MEFVDILMTVIKTKLAFFQMVIEAMLVNATEANQSSLGKGQKAFYPIDMRMLVSKLVVPMLNAKVLLIAQIYPPVVPSPAVRVKMLSSSTRPRIIPWRVGFEQSGTISV